MTRDNGFHGNGLSQADRLACESNPNIIRLTQNLHAPNGTVFHINGEYVDPLPL